MRSSDDIKPRLGGSKTIKMVSLLTLSLSAGTPSVTDGLSGWARPRHDIDVGYGCLSSEDSIQLRMRQPPHFFSR